MRYKYTDQFGIVVQLNITEDADGQPELMGISINDKGWQRAEDTLPKMLRMIIGSMAAAERASMPDDAPVWAKNAQADGKFPEIALRTCLALKNKIEEGAQVIEGAGESIQALEQENTGLKANMHRLVKLTSESDVSFARVMELESMLGTRLATEQTKSGPNMEMIEFLRECLEFEVPEDQIN